MNIEKDEKTGNTQLVSNGILSIPLAGAVLFIGLTISVFTIHRQYAPEKIAVAGKKNKTNHISGKEKFFFDARKNPLTNKMDYPAMAASNEATRAMPHAKNSHSFSATSSLPAFNWNSLGPSRGGGSVWSLLIDNQDHSGQTVFAGFPNGGIWKSTNGGVTWGSGIPTIAYSQDDNMANMNVSCITQDINGVLYAGTGDATPGTEEAIGGGIFKSTDDGTTWTQLTSTIPSPVNEADVAWAYVNRIGVSSVNTNLIYAATNLGIYITRDGGISWRVAYASATKKLGGSTAYNTYDLKISNDGSVVVAGIGAGNIYTYLCYPNTNDSIFIEATHTGAGHINGDASLIEYAFSPTDPNRIYASEIAADESFCLSTYSGIYMCENAKTSGNGGYWYLIGPGGSTAFDPYIIPHTTDDQCIYDNALGVSSTNEGELLVGGTTLWEWNQANPNDTVGSWSSVSDYTNIGGNDPRFVTPDDHAIAFDPYNAGVVYVGCDGGVYKSIDNATSWLVFNRNLVVMQFWSLCYAPDLFYVTINVGNSTAQVGIGMGGGTENTGTVYMNGTSIYRDSATTILSGFGGGCALSQINPNIAYFTSTDYGNLYRESNLSNFLAPQVGYTDTYGDCIGGDIDSIYEDAESSGGIAFIMPITLYENHYDTLNHDSIQFVATINYFIGDTIYPNGINGSYPYILKKTIPMGDTINLPDEVVSRLAIAFSGTYGVWINGQGASDNAPIWKPIGGPLSKPDAYNAPDPATALAWTPDGNTLYVGTEGSTPNLFRFSNLNNVQAAHYCSGALWYKAGSIVPTHDTTVVCTNISFSGTMDDDILSIDVDPKNGNNVLITVGGYGGASVQNVWYSTNAETGTATFKSVQGNLPPMPVYSGILDVLDSNQNSIPGSAMVATEHGVYSTTNINASNVNWVSNNSGMANCLSYVLSQQTLPAWECNNASTIYLATFGRGLWSATDLYPKTPNAIPVVKDAVKVNSLNVYPNPMTTEGNIAFSLATTDNVTITIYDMQGRVVSETDLGSQSAGSHIFPFATTDYRGGIYFATLTGTTFRDVQKFVVTK